MLKEMREQAGLTQAELAKKAHVSIHAVQKWEQGANCIDGAKIKSLIRIAIVLNCKVSDLLSDSETAEMMKYCKF